MDLISNSSIQIWLDYTITGALPATIPPCQITPEYYYDAIMVADNCTALCTDSSHLLDPRTPNNLVTCGLWSSLIVNQSRTIGFDNALLDPFVHLGLDTKNATYAFSVRDIIASVLSGLYTGTVEATYLGEESLARACAEQYLFDIIPRVPELSGSDSKSSLHDCIDAICSPITLNPDLGGIGVGLLDFLSNIIC